MLLPIVSVLPCRHQRLQLTGELHAPALAEEQLAHPTTGCVELASDTLEVCVGCNKLCLQTLHALSKIIHIGTVSDTLCRVCSSRLLYLSLTLRNACMESLLPQALRISCVLHRPLNVLLLPQTSRDPFKSNTKCLDTAPKIGVGCHFCSHA